MAELGIPREEVRAVLEARSELGREYNEEFIGSLLARIDAEIDARVAASLAQHSATGGRQRDMLWLSLGSLAFGIPLTGAASTIGLAAVIVVWAGILGVNLAHALAQSGSRSTR